MKTFKIDKLLMFISILLFTLLALIGCTNTSNELETPYIKEIKDDYSNIYDVVSRYLKEIEDIDAIPATKDIISKTNTGKLTTLQYRLRDDENIAFTVYVNKESDYISNKLNTDFLSYQCTIKTKELVDKYLPEGSQILVNVTSPSSYSKMKEELKLEEKSLTDVVSITPYIDLQSVFISLTVPEGTTDFKKYEDGIFNLSKAINKEFTNNERLITLNIIATTESNFLDKASKVLNIYATDEFISTMSEKYIEKNVKSAHLLKEDKKELFSNIIGYYNKYLNTSENSEDYLNLDLNGRIKIMK